MPGIRRRRAFALVELSVVILVVLMTIIIAGLLAPDARRRARLAGSIQNLKQIGTASVAFGADNDNRWFSLNWTPGSHTCGGYTFPQATNYIEAAADQAVCIMRQRGNRPDITAIRSWLPHTFYNSLALIDYLDGELPSPMLVSPGDAARLAWQRATIEHPNDQGAAYFRLLARPAGSDNAAKRWPYSSSYEVQPSFYSPDAAVGGIPTIAQGLTHREYNWGNAQTILGNRRLDEVRFPSHKAHVYETNQRFFGARQEYFMYPDARLPVLSADAGVSVRSIARVNPGFQPNLPSSASPTRVNYTPETSWESPTQSGADSEFLNGMIRWTRSGLRGRDFMGPEVPWTP